jgi:uncharacterized membrane protein YfcA
VSGWEYAIVFAVMVLGATIQGSIGFGLNIMVAPIVIQFDASLVPGSLLVAALVMTLLVALRDRRDVNLRRAGWALVGRFPGVILGVLAVSSVGRWGLSLIMALVVLGAVAASVSGVHVPLNRATSISGGAVSGFSGTATTVGGPPIALALQDLPGPELRSTLATFLGFGVLMSLAMLGVVGEFGVGDIGTSLVLLPPIFIGFFLSFPLAPILDRGYTRPAVLTVSTVSASVLLIRLLF